MNAHAPNEANAPRQPTYPRIFRTGVQTRVEPIVVLDIPTPTELHGLIGMDQFRRRHLAPPLRMEAEHIQYYKQWSPLTIPDIRFTAEMIRYTLSNASHTTPYQDLLEDKILRFLSHEQLERLAQIYNRWYNGDLSSPKSGMRLLANCMPKKWTLMLCEAFPQCDKKIVSAHFQDDLDTLTAALNTGWSPGHSPISAARLRHIVFRNLYSPREKAPPTDTLMAPEIHNKKPRLRCSHFELP